MKSHMVILIACLSFSSVIIIAECQLNYGYTPGPESYQYYYYYDVEDLNVTQNGTAASATTQSTTRAVRTSATLPLTTREITTAANANGFVNYGDYSVLMDEHVIPGFNASTWPDGVVPYIIDASFEDYEKARIIEVMRLISGQPVCVSFRKKTPSDFYFLSFIRTNGKCQSEYIGFVRAWGQDIYLAPHCTTTRYVYWALLQTLGLPAEHMRPDRDYHVRVIFENINPNHLSGFKRYSFIDERIATLPYDFESRMHFSNEKFSLGRGNKTIIDRMTGTRPLGNALAPTSLDYQKLAALYCNGDPSFMLPLLPVTASSINATLERVCQCPKRPHVDGTCSEYGGYQFTSMWTYCRRPVLAPYYALCNCENILQHPCYCEAQPNPDCKGPACPLERCVKKCRYSKPNLY